MVTEIFLIAIFAANLIWLVPAARAIDAMMIVSAIVLGWYSAETLVWMLAATALTWAALSSLNDSSWRDVGAGTIAVILLAGFVTAQFSEGLLWIGASFFTLRLLHVVGDWWTRSLAPPSIIELLRYQLFLPVLVVGPIQRFQTFTRQVARRRWDAEDYWSGLERCLIGFFMAHVLGIWAMEKMQLHLARLGGDPERFVTVWASSALGWIQLYFVFAGLSAVALGCSRTAGLTLEENFNRPWRASSLLDFWNRWHMSLTSWSRDYAYRPVMAITRSPVIGVIAAMLVIGLWHAISFYYLLWAVWQAGGIFLSRWLGKHVQFGSIPQWLKRLMVGAGILGWLSLARPFITIILGVTYDTNAAPF